MASRETTGLEGKLGQECPRSFRKYEELKAAIGPVLNRIYGIHPQFTGHDREHSEETLDILTELVAHSPDCKLSSLETFLLLCACYAHDVGMAGGMHESVNADLVRQSHHLRSRDFVVKYAADLSLSEAEADAVGIICEHHRDFDRILTIQDIPVERSFVRLRLLAALLAVCDELDVSDRRAPVLVAKVLSPTGESLEHFRRNMSVKGKALDPANMSTFVIRATAETTGVRDGLLRLGDSITAKLGKVLPLFREHGVRLESIKMCIDDGAIVIRSILLHLCTSGAMPLQLISQAIGRSQDEVAQHCGDLENMGILRASGNTFQMNPAMGAFSEVLARFVQTEDFPKFALTEYVRGVVVSEFFGECAGIFSCSFGPRETLERTNLLCHSQTALRNFHEMWRAKPPSLPISVNLLFDFKLVEGVVSDLTWNPMIVTDPGVRRDLLSVAEDLRNQLPEHVTLFSHLAELAHVGLDDMMKSLVQTSPSRELKHKVQMRVTHSKHLPPHFSLPHMLLASAQTGVPVTLAGETLDSFLVNGEEKIKKGEGPCSITIRPTPQHREGPVTLNCRCSIEMDDQRETIFLTLDDAGTCDGDRLPFFIHVDFQPEGNCNFTLSTVPFCDVNVALQMDAVLDRLSKRAYRWVVFRFDTDHSTEFPSLGSTLNLKHERDQVWERTLKAVSSVARLVDDRLPAPPGPLREQFLVECESIDDPEKGAQWLESNRQRSAGVRFTVITVAVLDSRGVTSEYISGPLMCSLAPKFGEHGIPNERIEEIRRGHMPFYVFHTTTSTSEEIMQDLKNAISRTPQDVIGVFDALTASTAASDAGSFVLVKGLYAGQHLWGSPLDLRVHVFSIPWLRHLGAAEKAVARWFADPSLARHNRYMLQIMAGSTFFTTHVAWAAYEAGRYDVCESLSRRALDLPQDSFTALCGFNQGLAQLRQAKLAEATQSYDSTLAVADRDAVAAAIEDLDIAFKQDQKLAEEPTANAIMARLRAHRDQL